MPVFCEQDFDKLATRVVDQFLEGKTKLADAAAEEALQSGLNPDQIERLVQTANTQTFLRMMDQRKKDGAGDLMHEFDPIDSRQVIRIVIDRTGVHIDGPHDHGNEEAAASPEQDELPDEMSAMRGAPGAPGAPESAEIPEGLAGADTDKEAPEETDKDKKPAKKTEKKEQKEAELRIMRMRKLASVLADEYQQHELAFEEGFDKLAARFRRAHVDLSFVDFEKDALAETTDHASIGVLNALRDTQGLAPLSFSGANEKTAALADRHVTENSVELQLFEDLIKHAHESHKIQRGLEWVRTQCA
jgi:hypothetical protein